LAENERIELCSLEGAHRVPGGPRATRARSPGNPGGRRPSRRVDHSGSISPYQ